MSKHLLKHLLQVYHRSSWTIKLRGADANPAGANAYPIVSLTWILAIQSQRKEIKETLRYMLSKESQAKSDALGYVPLPEELNQKALTAVESIND